MIFAPSKAQFVSEVTGHRPMRQAEYGLLVVAGSLQSGIKSQSAAQRGKPKVISIMKHRFVWASALALGVTISSQVAAMAATNGIILITTRQEQDLTWGTTDSGNIRGPGQTAQGDVAMETILGDYGYSSRFILEAELNPAKVNPFTQLTADPLAYYFPAADTNFNAMLVINSGTSGSANVGEPNTNDIPIMMGEHSCISDQGAPARHNSLYMYAGAGSDDVKNDELAQGASQYMVVIAPNHPIMQGIPLDSQNRVKIFRDPYPEEGAFGIGLGSHTPPTGKFNYEYAWTTISNALAAPGTVVIGLLDGNTNKACFAAADIGAQLADYTTTDPAHPWSTFYGDNKAHQRLVHWFINDQGSGGSRRCFNALTDLGRVIFIRTVKWALGEPLTPYEPLGLVRVAQLGPGLIQLSWEGRADKYYKVLGTQNLAGPFDFTNWQTVDQDIHGTNGTISVTYNISNAKEYAFLRVTQVP
jgi:hypothetical protein